MKRLLAPLLAAALAATLTGAAHADHRTASPLQRDADALLAQGAPGVLVEVDTPRGDVRVRSGVADTGTRKPVPWNAKFRIGSFTKTYVAATVLQLVGEGRLSLDDTVERWLPGVVRGNGNDGGRITVRQLLQHTSGLHNYILQLPFVFKGDEFLAERFRTVTAAEAVALATGVAPDFQPGEEWRYSNTGYAVAGMIIEKVTGRTWQQEVRKRILDPLRLRDTFLPGTSPAIPKPHATAYERFPEKGLEADPEDPRYGPALDVTHYNPSWGGAAGDMISTTDDGNRFLQALMTGEVLRPAELAEMKRTVPATGFEQGWPGVRYGLGLMFIPNECGGYWSHGGDIPGFMTRNGVTDDGRRSVVVSVNTDSLIPTPGTAPAVGDPTSTLVDHALCGRG
ncbi:serine hydrolase domain-containing protein [Saccharothrix longispora]|uniref:D-alanyl-D-alanine carboxypeptidase n=1 Tax=Saccharothrix longispora TaxID=33920 RepID=A0ABU1PMK3_9PSEU|nr:serine hydrolase domain-containing protein [Saccharothrix longispora]MDR6591902.1 D-alanyl-D-alanine carboxypeptidase [Saccharothrix longispora]